MKNPLGVILVLLLLLVFIFLFIWFDVQSDAATYFCDVLKNCPGITIVGY